MNTKKLYILVLSGFGSLLVLKYFIYTTHMRDFLNLRNETKLKCEDHDCCHHTSFKQWYTDTKHYKNTEEISSYVKAHCLQALDECIVQNLYGPLQVNKSVVTEQWLYENELQFVQKGGWWSPKGCKQSQQTAIIIPFRDRLEHLLILLRNIHPMLQRQNLHYRIFVIDQDDKYTFNRGKLINVGYNEAQKYFPYSCFVFHDVDVIPEDDRINYACKHSPSHLSVAIDKFKYKLTYEEIFGGIEMFTKEDYKKVNGFSNLFWNWCCEDDNLYFRCINNSMKIHRQSIQIARYTMLVHGQNAFKGTKGLNERREMLQLSKSYIKHDGLSNLQYDVVGTEENQLYTLIKVDLRKDKDKTFGKIKL